MNVMNTSVTTISKTKLKVLSVLRGILSIAFKFIVPALVISINYDMFTKVDGTSVSIMFIMIMCVLAAIVMVALRKQLSKMDTLIDDDEGFSISFTRRFIMVLISLVIPLAVIIGLVIGSDIIVNMVMDSAESFTEMISGLASTAISCLGLYMVGTIIDVWLKPYSDIIAIDQDVTKDKRKELRK